MLSVLLIIELLDHINHPILRTWGGHSGYTVRPSERGHGYAKEMLRQLSGRSHSVVTGVCIGTKEDLNYSHFSVLTEVRFKELSDEEINYYVETYRPLDKAGAYGIQEWIGYVGVTGIDGSFYNVMGLPVQRIYPELTKVINNTI